MLKAQENFNEFVPGNHDIHVQVISAVGKAVSQQDVMSQEVAESTMHAVAPAWVSTGQDLKQLASAALQTSVALPLRRSVPLLNALVASLPQASLCACPGISAFPFDRCVEIHI